MIYLRDENGDPTWQHRLIEPVRRGNLSTVSAFGSGVGDDKLTHAYFEEVIRFYLGEEPIIPIVPTYDLALDEQRAEAFDRLAFAYGNEIATGGLTRVALERGSLVVNSTQGGGAKDTWVLC